MAGQADILSLIPQQPPFVMVDCLLHCDEQLTRTSFTITEENTLTIDGKFTEAGLMENMAQTAAAGAGFTAQQTNQPVRTGYIGAVKKLKIFSIPHTGDRLVTEIKTEEQLLNISVVSGKVWYGDTLVASCEMNVFLG